jgi:site-specific recombinase XerD
MPEPIATRDFARHIDEYARIMVQTFNHQPCGIEAACRDLRLLCEYLHEHQHAGINGDVLLDFISYLKLERNNKAGSINRKISSIRMYIRYLRFKQIGGAQELPIESLQRAREPYPGPVQVLPPKEVQRLLESADQESVLGFRDFVLFTLVYRLGLRLGEALAIDLDDIDFDQEVLHIHGKGRRERILPLLADLAELIQRWLLHRTRLHRAQCSHALFLSKKGNRLAARTAQEAFQHLRQHAGPLSVSRLTPHSLRHAFASHAMEGEADLIVLKAVLGHASMKSTEIYIHPSLAILRKAVTDHPASEILEELISKKVIAVRIHQRRRRVA